MYRKFMVSTIKSVYTVYTHAQAESSSVRDRMDHLYNNLDMADIHILAVDEVRMTRSPSYNYRTIDLFLIGG